MGWKGVVAGGSLVVLVLVCYIPATRGQFIWDDDQYVSENPTLFSSDGLRRIWLEPGATPQYYPLVFTTFRMESRIWRLNPRGYHWVNVLLHGMNAVLLWLVLRRLSVPGAWLAGALFALHPVEVESVAWITERKNVLSCLFYGLALLAFLRFALPDPASAKRGDWKWYVLALGLFLCALLSKTVTCSLPAVLVLILWWKRGRLSWRDCLALIPFFILGLTLAMVTVWMEKYHVNAQGKEWNFTLLQRWLIAGRALWFYAGKLLWPTNLTFIYSRWMIDSGAAWQYLFPLGALGVIAALWLARHRLGRGPLVAVLFFVGTLVPALGFINVYPMRFSFVADHFQYLASAGLLALAAAAAATVVLRLPPAGRWYGQVAAGALLVCLGMLTWRQGTIYRDQETLWKDTLAKNPGSWIAHCNLARLLVGQGQVPEAERHFSEALELYPAAWEAHFGLGLVRKMRGDASAAEQFVAALELNPESAEALTEVGSVMTRQNHPAEALELLSKAVKNKPGYALAHYHLGVALLRLGRPSEAVAEHARAVELSPGVAALHYGLGVALYRHGQQDAAQAEFVAASRVDPNWPAAAREMAWTLATHPEPQVRDGALAVQLARQICDATQYAFPAFLDTLAAAQAEAGDFKEAAATARRALDHKAALPPALARQIDDRLHLYEQRQPFRESPGS